MRRTVTAIAGGVMLLAAASGSPSSVAASGDATTFRLDSTIAFSSTRDHVSEGLTPPLLGAEVYLMKPVMNPDGTWVLTNPRRLTSNASFDGFASLSPDGKKIVFDSTRKTDSTGFINSSDLFLMNTDGTEQTLLTRGSSVTWSPDSKNIAFHASASGAGTPIRRDVGSATSDSDIFVANVDDLLAGVEPARNLTNSPHIIDEDADWSPNGQTIAYTRHADSDNPVVSDTAEIYLLDADGTGTPVRLTDNDYEERGPSWSPDGTRIVYACRRGAPATPTSTQRTFEICVMNADGTDVQQLTSNHVPDLTPSFSPDGQQILFHRLVGAPGSGNQELFIMNADGTVPDLEHAQLTFGTTTSGDGVNNLANWGELRVKD